MGSCTNPLYAARLYKPEIGKQVIKILPKRFGTFEDLVRKYGEDNVLMLPCGHCLNCISNRKKEWAVRCCLEAMDHAENCFVTLTYDDEHYDDQYHKDHLQHFIRALRRRGHVCRYYGCSERGDELGRCHYHIILFGLFPEDAKPWAKSQSGYMQYTSKLFDECWQKGLVVFSDFHPAQASYVTGYVLKKFMELDPDSFHIQSTRPGIGQSYVLRNAQKIYETDNLVLSFGSHKFPVPRYFDKVVSECYSMDLDLIKARRLELAKVMTAQYIRDNDTFNQFELMKIREDHMKTQIRNKKRRF